MKKKLLSLLVVAAMAVTLLAGCGGGKQEEASSGGDGSKKELNILIPPGESFGCPGYLRLSTCVSHEMIVKSLSAFKTLIEQGC